MSAAIIETFGLGKKYLSKGTNFAHKEYFWALQDVNLSIQEGATVAVLGSNGSGKSTLFKLISEVSLPSKGNIVVRGSISSLLEVGVGFHPELTGKENIYLNGAFLGMHKREIELKVDEILSLSEMNDFIHLPVKRFSTGMKTRLAISVAAHLRTDILILDEVLSVADQKFKQRAINHLKERSIQGGTILVSSHDMGLLKELCSLACYFENGKLVASGNAPEVINLYQSSQSNTSDRISTN